jgi:hypothetical protein
VSGTPTPSPLTIRSDFRFQRLDRARQVALGNVQTLDIARDGFDNRLGLCSFTPSPLTIRSDFRTRPESAQGALADKAISRNGASALGELRRELSVTVLTPGCHSPHDPVTTSQHGLYRRDCFQSSRSGPASSAGKSGRRDGYLVSPPLLRSRSTVSQPSFRNNPNQPPDLQVVQEVCFVIDVLGGDFKCSGPQWSAEAFLSHLLT